jgi:hypothetical protein
MSVGAIVTPVPHHRNNWQRRIREPCGDALSAPAALARARCPRVHRVGALDQEIGEPVSPALMAVGLIQAIEDNNGNRKLVRGVPTFKGSVGTKAETGEAGIRQANGPIPG